MTSYAGRNTKKNQEWKKSVLERDGHKCKLCSSTRLLCSHHIVEWDVDPSLRFDINNGITLCRGCHNKAHFSGKSSWNKGKSWNQETKEKMKFAKLGTKQSKETIEKRRIALKGKSRDPAIGKKISASKKGKKFTAEHCAKLSLAKRCKNTINIVH